ncbi:hypothetical protein JCM21900_005607 [Sporobolomyces salmonicolor]
MASALICRSSYRALPLLCSSASISSLPHFRSFSGSASPPEASLLRLTQHEGLAVLQLDRAKAKNALSVQMVRELRDLVEEVRFDGETRVLILRSAVPGAFCAGADLKERKTMSELEVARFLYNLRRLLSELESLPIPTIAAIDGPALGGGLELALACDLRVAAPSVTKIGLPETGLAIIPGAGGTQRLARLIGTSRTKDLIFTAKVMTAEEAHGQGIVNYLANPGQEATGHAIHIASDMLQAGPLALRAAKTAVDVGSQLDLGSGLDVERLCYQTILKSRDRLEGLAAFAEKRKPVYRGE